MPNTFTMQELIRTSLDEYHKELEGGTSVGEPVIISVRKGRYHPASTVCLVINYFQVLLSQPLLHCSGRIYHDFVFNLRILCV